MSTQVADAFVSTYEQAHHEVFIETVNVFDMTLPVFDGETLGAKYAILHGRPQTPAQSEAWRAVERIIDHFLSADLYVLAVPMWNFGIPYRLKQLIDVLVQPTYTFAVDEELGYRGLATGRPAFIAYARGGDYTDPAAEAAIDYQKRYLEMILAFIGIGPITSVIVQPTLEAGPQVADEQLAAAISQARQCASTFLAVCETG